MDVPDFFLQAEGLYFQAREVGVHYGIEKGQVLHPNCSSRLGGRFTLEMCSQCWHVGLQFLHYHVRNREHVKGEIWPTWGLPERMGVVECSENMWRLHLGLGDVYLKRGWEVNPSVALKPYAGVRIGGIRHKLDVAYGLEEFSMKNKFWGGGPLGGVEGVWDFGCLELFCRGALSLLLGEIYVHQDEESGTSGLKFYDEHSQVRMGFEMAIGLQAHVGGFVGRVAWETYLFWNQNQLVRFSDSRMPGKDLNHQGDLSLHGVSIGIGIIL